MNELAAGYSYSAAIDTEGGLLSPSTVQRTCRCTEKLTLPPVSDTSSIEALDSIPSEVEGICVKQIQGTLYCYGNA